MKKNKWLALTGAFVVMSAASAHAAMITGSIGLGGAYSVNNPDLTLADEITFVSGIVITADNDFDTFVDPGDGVTMTASVLDISPFFTVTNPLWSVGGFQFELTSLAYDGTPTSTAMGLKGSGTITGNNFDATPGTWVATFNESQGSSFTWSSSTSAVPDGGATVAMFGLAIMGVGAVRRKLGAKS